MVEGEFVGRPSFSVTQTTQEGPSGEKVTLAYTPEGDRRSWCDGTSKNIGEKGKGG